MSNHFPFLSVHHAVYLEKEIINCILSLVSWCLGHKYLPKEILSSSFLLDFWLCMVGVAKGFQILEFWVKMIVK